MLCFIIALKSKMVSNNWERVSKIFEASLRSAYQQIDPDFKIIVICHETPQLQGDYDERVEFINVDFPPQSKLVTELTMKDKWHKLQIGMVRAGALNTDFIMVMDADDLVNNKLSQYANSNKSTNGWI
ncbi:MAG: glycosyltransferase family A protein [Gloeotrichia echinulata DEX184]